MIVIETITSLAVIMKLIYFSQSEVYNSECSGVYWFKINHPLVGATNIERIESSSLFISLPNTPGVTLPLCKTPQNINLRGYMAFSDNIWWTRKAKIQTEKRLLSQAFQANLLLLWYSFCSVSAAIYYLKFNADSQYANISWVVFSVLVLLISGFINGQGFKERANLIKDSYEALNALYHKSKQNEDSKEVVKEYEQILNLCENHKDIDYQLALCNTYLSHNNPKDEVNGLDKTPNNYSWFIVFLYFLRRYLLLIALYLLPIIIFLNVELTDVCKEAIRTTFFGE